MAAELTSALPSGQSPFDAIRHVEDGREYWSAREAMSLLGYARWENVEHVLKKAKSACRNAGNQADDHFRDVTKMVRIGSSAERPTLDVHLTRFGMYLLAMNGDPDKPEIAAAQQYFVIQTRRAEVSLPPVQQQTPPQPRLFGCWEKRFERCFAPHMGEVNRLFPGDFTVITAAMNYFMRIEDEMVRNNLPTHVFDRPDVSVGWRWCRYRRHTLKLPNVTRKVALYLPDTRQYVDVNVYDGVEYPLFMTWFIGEYIPVCLNKYLTEKPELKKYGQLPCASVADSTSRAMCGRPAELPEAIRKRLESNIVRRDS